MALAWHDSCSILAAFHNKLAAVWAGMCPDKQGSI